MKITDAGLKYLMEWASKEIQDAPSGDPYKDGLNDGCVILAQAIIKHVIPEVETQTGSEDAAN